MPNRWKPNVTVAAIIERDGRFLLVEEQTKEGLRLNNPAGHLDPGESPQQAAVREALEETTRVFVPDRLVGVYMTRVQRRPRGAASASDITYLRFAFGGTCGEADPARDLDTGIVRTLWLTVDEVRASRERHRSPLVLRCIEDFEAGRSHPLELVDCDPSIYAPEFKG
jgi:8-oxo-dGTP pyrophosphatase MutT (NUDIX family)